MTAGTEGTAARLPAEPRHACARSAYPCELAGFRPRPGGESPDRGPAATVTAIMGALAAVTPGVGGDSGGVRSVPVLAFTGEGFDRPVEPVRGWASDHGGLELDRLVAPYAENASDLPIFDTDLLVHSPPRCLRP